MPTSLSFSFEFHYPDLPEGIRLPTTLTFAGVAVRAHAFVDPGAAYCVFSHEVGKELGLVIESGIPKRFSTLAGTLDTFGHEVTLQTLEVRFQSFVYFAKYPGIERNLLGRIGWLDRMPIALIHHDNMFYYDEYQG